MTTLEQSRCELAAMIECCQSDPVRATKLERGLFTSAALAAENAVTPGDWERARELAKVALDAQDVNFERRY